MYFIVDLCLLCLTNSNNLKCILSQDCDGIVIQEKLRYFLFELVNIQPNISKHICLHCLKNLNYVYNFKQMCLQNIIKLNNYVDTLSSLQGPRKDLQVTLTDLKNIKETHVTCENINYFNLFNQTQQDSLESNVILKKEINEEILSNEFSHRIIKQLEECFAKNNVLEKQKTETEEIFDNHEANVAEKDAIEENELTVKKEVEDINYSTDMQHRSLKEHPENLEPVFEQVLKEEKFRDLSEEIDIKDEILLLEETYTDSKDGFTNNDDSHAPNTTVPDEQNSFGGCDSDLEPFEDSGSDGEFLPSNASSTASEASNSDLELTEIQSPASSTVAVPKGTNSNVTKYTSEYRKSSLQNNISVKQKLEMPCKVSENVNVETKIQDENLPSCNNTTSTTNENKNKVQKRNKIDEKRRKVVHKCSVCDKSFVTSGHLTLHMNKHTGVNPYACDVCSKTFCNRSYLEIHKGLHENVRLFKCSVCNKKFSRNAILTVHMRTHTREKPYECDICNKTFSVKHSLVNHQRIHTGKKPYTCEVCNKAFSIRGNLLIHQRIHTGEKPYTCKVCNKAFSFSGNLLQHQRTQHDI